MFLIRYFARRFFPGRYFPGVGANPATPTAPVTLSLGERGASASYERDSPRLRFEGRSAPIASTTPREARLRYAARAVVVEMRH